MGVKKYDSLYERVMAHVEKAEGTNENGCLLYLLRLDKDGYGRMNVRINGKHVTKRTHQIMWEEIEGRPLPDGMTLDHIDCVAKCCSNYDHLRLVTRSENTKLSQQRNPRTPSCRNATSAKR